MRARAWALAQVPLNIASRGLLPGTQATWLEAPRRELEEVHLLALEVIGRAGLVMGGTQLQSAERAARTLIESEPYRESGYVLLMEALATRGNVAEGAARVRPAADAAARRARDEPVAARRSPPTSGCCRPRGLAGELADGDRAGTAGVSIAEDWVGDPAAGRAAPPWAGPADRSRTELAQLEEEWGSPAGEARSGRHRTPRRRRRYRQDHADRRRGSAGPRRGCDRAGGAFAA